MLLIDKEIYTISHDEVGEALLTYWNFSPEVITGSWKSPPLCL